MTTPVGLLAARYLKAVAVSRGDDVASTEYIERRGWVAEAFTLKSAIAGSTTGNSNAFLQRIGGDFMAYVRAQAIIGKLEGFRRMPFATRAIRQTSGPVAHWFAEGDEIPVGRPIFARDEPLARKQVAGLAVQTLELAREGDTEMIIMDDLARACREALDAAFVDPDNGGSDIKPASVTYGQQEVTPSQPPRLALSQAVEALADGGGDPSMAYWIMTPGMYAYLTLMKIASEDGRIAGRPVLTSTVVPKDTSGETIALVDPTGIELAGGDEAELQISTHGDIIMDTDPAGGGAPGVTGLWQSNSFAMRAIASANWRAGSGRAVYISSLVTEVS